MKLHLKAGIFMLLLVAYVACKKNSTTCSIAAVPVDFYVYTSDPSFYKLNAVGGWVYVTGGVHGIIIYCQSPGIYLAYDRDCTYMSGNANAIVNVDSSTNITVTDPSCGSKFSLYDGSVQKGPAACSLKQYITTVNGNAIHVTSQ